MKKKKVVLMSVISAFAVMAAGCGQIGAGAWKADTNSIYVDKDGKVESALVYTSDKANDLYTKDGLEEFASQAIDIYNTGAGSTSVTLKDCKVDGQTGTLVFDYASGEDFVKFSQETGDDSHTVTDLKVGPVADLAGDFADVSFTAPDGKAADTATVGGLSGAIVVEVTGSATVYTQGKIAYVSDGVTIQDDYSAVTPEGTSFIVSK